MNGRGGVSATIVKRRAPETSKGTTPTPFNKTERCQPHRPSGRQRLRERWHPKISEAAPQTDEACGQVVCARPYPWLPTVDASLRESLNHSASGMKPDLLATDLPIQGL